MGAVETDEDGAPGEGPTGDNAKDKKKDKERAEARLFDT